MLVQPNVTPLLRNPSHASSCNFVGRCRCACDGKHIFGVRAVTEIFRRNRGRKQAAGGETGKLPVSGETAEIGFSETSQLCARVHENQELAWFRAKACPGLDPGWMPDRVKKTRHNKESRVSVLIQSEPIISQGFGFSKRNPILFYRALYRRWRFGLGETGGKGRAVFRHAFDQEPAAMTINDVFDQG